MKEVKTYEQLKGNRPPFSLPFSEEKLRLRIKNSYDHIIVLDDDPTGTQTVHDIPVLTEWTVDAISSEISQGSDLFYILTNTRSLVADDADILNRTIAQNIKISADALGVSYLIISRSDSTLRGHYPLEVDILIETLESKKPVHFIVPAFFEGGRYTIDDVHYVREGNDMIPAASTSFAKDKVFGYNSSNLKEWVAEKMNKPIAELPIHSLSLSELEGSTKQLIDKINSFQPNDICVINAMEYNHLKVAIECILSADLDPYFRSAASLVAALALQKPKILDPVKMNLDSSKGGLTILGSYVPKSTAQLYHLLDNTSIHPMAVDVRALLDNEEIPVATVAKQIDELIQSQKDVILYTSRELISVTETDKNLDIGSRISQYLTDIVSALTVTPRYIIGKGGITSSDTATKGLQIKRAIVKGQMIPGVPVWQTQENSKFPGIPYIVFPGNVGDNSALTQVTKLLKE